MSSIETIRNRIKSIVEVRAVDSIKTHFKQIFLFKNEEKVCGSFHHNEIKVWISSIRLIGAFYPVVKLSIRELSEPILLTSKMNPVGIILALVINLVISWWSLNMFFLGDDLTVDLIPRRTLVFILFVGIFNVPIYLSYRVTRNAIVKEIKEKLRQI